MFFALRPGVCLQSPQGDCMDDVAGQFLDAIHRLEDVRDAITAERANAEFDETT